MEKTQIYQKIKHIADLLSKEGSTYTRADLAYELKELGIAQDTAEVGQLVWEAFRYFHNGKTIRESFYNNDGKGQLVPEMEVEAYIDSGDDKTLSPLLPHRLDDSSIALALLEKTITQTMQGKTTATTHSVMNTITGTQGVVKAKEEATAVFNGYSQLVGHYDDAKTHVKAIIADFVKLRLQVCDIYRQYALALTDTFGDSIKAVEPDLFDFDSVEWLDVQGMLKNVKLDYERITERCALLMNDISESFTQSVKVAGAAYQGAGNKKVGLLLAALNMVSYYCAAGEKTAEMKQELLVLKNSVKHDVTVIRGDMGRLTVIYKTLNDFFVPQAEMVCRHGKQAVSAEWQELLQSIYQQEGVKTAKEERDKTLATMKNVEKHMVDEQMNIAYYTAKIVDTQQLLGSMKPKYTEAQESKPKKPGCLSNLFTFGIAGNKHNRAIYTWNQACAPVINRYRDLQTDLKLDGDELALQQEAYSTHQQAHHKLQQELTKKNRTVMENIRVDQEARKKILPNLEAMIKLLRIARTVVSSSLDKSLTQTVSITRQETELPQEVRQNISAFAQAVRSHGIVSQDHTREILGAEAGTANQQAIQDTNDNQPPSRISEDDIMRTTGAMNTAIAGAVGMMEAYAPLQARRDKGAIAHKAYDKELKKLQRRFQQDLYKIDDKSALLRESMRRANTAQDAEELKEALLSLAGKKQGTFSEEDWERFLSGNKTIEL